MSDLIKQQIKNLQFAKECVEAVSDFKLDLATFKTDTESECGTLYCVYGLLTTIPYFKSLGMGLRETNTPFCHKYLATINGKSLTNVNIKELDTIFGPNSFERLFDRRSHATLDKYLYAIHGCNISDRELAKYRIDTQIDGLTIQLTLATK